MILNFEDLFWEEYLNENGPEKWTYSELVKKRETKSVDPHIFHFGCAFTDNHSQLYLILKTVYIKF